MYNLYRVSNLAVWLQQINKLYFTYLRWLGLQGFILAPGSDSEAED